MLAKEKIYKEKLNKYLENNILTNSPEFLILELYNGCIKYLNYVIENDTDDVKKSENIKKSEDIIKELIRSLDFEKGGEIAKNLNSLYVFVLKQIEEFKKNKDAQYIKNSVFIMRMIRDAWNDGVIKKNKNKI